jgi:hypothetical protein
MHEVNFVDDTFDLKKTSEYHLSIQVGLDGFSFCIANVSVKKLLVFKHIPLIVGKLQFLARKAEAIFNQEEALTRQFKSASVSYSTHQATLVPRIFSGNDIYLKLAEFTGDLSKSDEIHRHNLPGFNYQLIYSYPKELMNVLNRKFIEYSFHHKSNQFINLLTERQGDNKITLLINFETKYIRLIALKDNEIVFYNCFYFKNESDFLYYTLNVCQSLQFNPEADDILIGGYVADDSSYIRLLKKYIRNIYFLLPNSEYDYGSLFQKVQKHQFVSILNTLPCE